MLARSSLGILTRQERAPRRIDSSRTGSIHRNGKPPSRHNTINAVVDMPHGRFSFGLVKPVETMSTAPS